MYHLRAFLFRCIFVIKYVPKKISHYVLSPEGLNAPTRVFQPVNIIPGQSMWCVDELKVQLHVMDNSLVLSSAAATEIPTSIFLHN